LFLMRKYREAIAQFEETLTIDPEDLQAHYNLMLCYNGIGDAARSKEHEQRYLRFKADETAQAITGPYLLKHPEDNNERQSIHEHPGVDLSRVGADGVWRRPPSPPAAAPARQGPVTKRAATEPVASHAQATGGN